MPTRKHTSSPRWPRKLKHPLFNLKTIANRKALLLFPLLLMVALVTVWQVKQRADQQLAAERARREKQNLVPFEQKRLPPLDSKAVQIWQNHQTSRAIVKFKESYFVASDGGLIELDQSGKLVRHYTVLDGLPESDLLSLAVFNAKLFIGTRTQGLVGFDGSRFYAYRWTDRKSQSIDALLADEGRLLVGTRAGGLIAFDGRQFNELTAGTEHKRLLEINLLAKVGVRLFVGTFADGLWIEEGGRWSHFTTADGLLSNRIVGVAVANQHLFVATDFGVTVSPVAGLSTENTPASPSRFLPFATLPSLSSLALLADSLLLSKDNGEILTFRIDREISVSRQVVAPGWIKAGKSAGTRMISLDKDLWLVSEDGLYRADLDHRNEGRLSPNAFLAWGQQDHNRTLTTNLVSALTMDSQARVWAGNFRRGIDVLSSQGTQLAHMESETNREINSLTKDQASDTIVAASSAGLLRFDASLRTTEQWSTKDGLLSNAVMHVARWDIEDENARNPVFALATSKGLSLGVRGKLRGLTTVQGLPSNSLYSLLIHGRKIYAGTLGGLAVVEDGRVSRVFKDTNSNLTTNWVTALCAVGSRIFVGTYGGGLFELNGSGDLRSFAPEVGRVVVNPNAMWSDGLRLFVGTLDGALVFDPASQRWTRVKSELPSRNVLSIAGSGKHVYFGTTGGIARIELSYWNGNSADTD
jgi:ligand-binding sensor domain-containing protein